MTQPDGNEERFADLRTRSDVRQLYLHEMASEALVAMFEQCETIERTGDHDRYHAAVASLHACLRNMLRSGFSPAAFVTRDGPLSLIVDEGGQFLFGVVWHRDRSRADSPFGDWACHS